MTVRAAMVALLLLGAVVGSGIQVTRISHEVRTLHAELQAAQRQQDQHLSEHSRLLLERSALSSYQNVERIAQGELAMQFPDVVERLEP
ncbi:MAG: cell division protein FtsL [Pseudomonadales bacterium]